MGLLWRTGSVNGAGCILCGFLFRQIIPSTKCRIPAGRRAFNTSLGQRFHLWTLTRTLRPWTPSRCCRPAPDPRAPPFGFPARALPLHSASALPPDTRPTGAALWIPGRALPLHPAQALRPAPGERQREPCFSRQHVSLCFFHTVTDFGHILLIFGDCFYGGIFPPENSGDHSAAFPRFLVTCQ